MEKHRNDLAVYLVEALIKYTSEFEGRDTDEDLRLWRERKGVSGKPLPPREIKWVEGLGEVLADQAIAYIGVKEMAARIRKLEIVLENLQKASANVRFPQSDNFARLDHALADVPDALDHHSISTWEGEGGACRD